MNKLLPLLVLFTIQTSHAAVDISSATSALGDVQTSCAIVGAAALSVVVGIKVWRMLKASL